jgi:hypothetical protein
MFDSTLSLTISQAALKSHFKTFLAASLPTVESKLVTVLYHFHITFLVPLYALPVSHATLPATKALHSALSFSGKASSISFKIGIWLLIHPHNLDNHSHITSGTLFRYGVSDIAHIVALRILFHNALFHNCFAHLEK